MSTKSQKVNDILDEMSKQITLMEGRSISRADTIALTAISEAVARLREEFAAD